MVPRCATPSEAFVALDLGADMLKYFPAELISPNGFGAMRAVLPTSAQVAVVGGVTPGKTAEFLSVGANSFG